jgi:hypothetical protein
MDWKGPYCDFWRILRLLDTLVRDYLSLEMLGWERGLFILRYEETQWSVIIVWNIFICSRLILFFVTFAIGNWDSGICSFKVFMFSYKNLLVHLLFSLRNQPQPLRVLSQKKIESFLLGHG